MKRMKLKKDKLWNQKMLYFILIIVILLGITTGVFYHIVLSQETKVLIQEQMDGFFQSIKEGTIEGQKTFLNSLCSSGFSLILLWILGISVIGIPFILVHLFYQSFLLGFSYFSIIANYGWKGILLATSYIFPHQILNLIIWILVSFYTIHFSLRLIKVLFFKKNFNLIEAFKKYTKILFLSLFFLVLSAGLEAYLAPRIMSFFLK